MVTVNSSRKKGSPELVIGTLVLTALLAVRTVPACAEPLPESNSAGAFALGPAAGPIAPETAITQEAPVLARPIPERKSIAVPDSEKKKLTSFFLIGILINLLLLLVVGIWAYREWRRRN